MQNYLDMTKLHLKMFCKENTKKAQAHYGARAFT